MVDNNTYLESLERLKAKENIKKQSIENGEKFLAQYKETLEKSKKENKKIFLLFYLEKCDGCNVVKYLIDNNRMVRDCLDKYLVLTCNISKTRTGLVEKYNVYSYPSYFIIDSSQKILKKNTGISVEGGPEINIINWLQK
jgi:thiol:disulfide interchange protein